MDIAAWLRDLGLQRYVQAFRDNDIDGEVLPKLTAEDLTGIGVTPVGHRRKLLDAITSLGMPVPTAVMASRSPDAPAQVDAERRQLTDVSPGQLVWPRVLVVLGLSVCFAPANVAAYLYTSLELRGAAVGLLSLLRNEGGSAGTPLAQTPRDLDRSFAKTCCCSGLVGWSRRTPLR
jgi:hypothetical protein